MLWIGGAPDAGKTTVARLLAERYGLRLYELDAAVAAHWARVTPERHPALAAFKAMSMDERWVLQSPREMADQIIRIGAERFAMALEDLHGTAGSEAGHGEGGQTVLVEGPWLFPALVAPLLSDRREAIWLVPSEGFKRESGQRRDKPTIRHQTSDPERASRNWYERDLLLDAHVRESGTALGLTVVEVDGSKTPAEMGDLVAAHFAPFHPSLTIDRP